MSGENHRLLGIEIRLTDELALRLPGVTLADFNGTTTRADRQLNRPRPDQVAG